MIELEKRMRCPFCERKIDDAVRGRIYYECWQCGAFFRIWVPAEGLLIPLQEVVYE